jgi:hypothetical protein
LRTLLIDADIAAFTTAARSETKIDWDGDGDRTRFADLDMARTDIREWFKTMQEKLEADKLIVCLSCPNRRYWRHDVFPEYKAHRTHGEKPLILDEVKAILADEYESFVRPMLEADDILGILLAEPQRWHDVQHEVDLMDFADPQLNRQETIQGHSFVVVQDDSPSHVIVTKFI